MILTFRTVGIEKIGANIHRRNLILICAFTILYLSITETFTRKRCSGMSSVVLILSFLFFFSLPAFPWWLRGQQLKIKPPRFTVFNHIHHFVWVKSQAIPSKILIVIGPFSSSRPHGLLPFALTSKACLGSLSWGILLTWPNHLSWNLSIRRSYGRCLESFESQCYDI